MTSFKTKKISKKPTLSERYGVMRARKTIEWNEMKTDYWDEISDIWENQSTPRSHKILRRITGILLLLASLIFIGILGLRWVGGQTLSSKIDEIKLFNPIIALGNNSGSVAETKKWVTNILIGGIGGKGHPGGELTDSLMLASLDNDTKSVTLFSIPRDFYVAYPKESKISAGKINALYPIGQSENQGVNLLSQKVSEITGQPIHHYMIIDFTGFKSIVNALGWVEVNVPNDIYDREYPNESWGYEVFSIKKWLQTLDGATALKFARSRHSTTDFDRSARQQLLVRAIKDKALSLGVIINPWKISDLINSVRDNLSTDLTVWELVDLGMNFKDIDNKNIVMYSLNNECDSGVCMPGAYLYQPSMELFGTWTVIPEWASRSRLSKYDAIRRYVTNIFTFPQLHNQEAVISIVTNNKNLTAARNLRTSLEKIGFNIDHAKTIVQTGAVIEKSKIVAFYDPTTGTWFNDKNIIIESLKSLEPNINIEYKPKNEFVTESGARIEIILWSDAKSYFDFSTPVEYKEKEQSATLTNKISESTNQSSSATNTAAENKEKTTSTTTKTTIETNTSLSEDKQTSANTTKKTSLPALPNDTKTSAQTEPAATSKTDWNQSNYKFQAGEWENF